MTMSVEIVRQVRAVGDIPGVREGFAAVVAGSVGQVCGVCGLERFGHGPESQLLGFDVHAWEPRPASADDMARARELTSRAYAAARAAQQTD